MVRVQSSQFVCFAALAATAGLSELWEPRAPGSAPPQMTAGMPGLGTHRAHRCDRERTEFSPTAGDPGRPIKRPMRWGGGFDAEDGGTIRLAVHSPAQAPADLTNRQRIRAVQLAYGEFAAALAAARAGRLASRSTAPPLL
ncbi:MAG: hypothetical protein HY704_15450 [Gemmatimonadetes bacterium]|nr:hypothetical protein [Gemmatimonadota bacterium]